MKNGARNDHSVIKPPRAGPEMPPSRKPPLNEPTARPRCALVVTPSNRDTADTSRSATIRAQTDDVAQKYYGSAGDLRVLAELSRLARQKAVSNATLAYAWLLHKGVTAPIVGATKLPHLEQAVAALYGQLTDEDVALLEAQYEPHRVIGHT